MALKKEATGTYETVFDEAVFQESEKFFDHLRNRAVFFSPDLFMKISNFSKTVHTIFTKLCTVILHPNGPLRVQRHQNRITGWSRGMPIRKYCEAGEGPESRAHSINSYLQDCEVF